MNKKLTRRFAAIGTMVAMTLTLCFGILPVANVFADASGPSVSVNGTAVFDSDTYYAPSAVTLANLQAENAGWTITGPTSVTNQHTGAYVATSTSGTVNFTVVVNANAPGLKVVATNWSQSTLTGFNLAKSSSAVVFLLTPSLTGPGGIQTVQYSKDGGTTWTDATPYGTTGQWYVIDAGNGGVYSQGYIFQAIALSGKTFVTGSTYTVNIVSQLVTFPGVVMNGQTMNNGDIYYSAVRIDRNGSDSVSTMLTIPTGYQWTIPGAGPLNAGQTNVITVNAAPTAPYVGDDPAQMMRFSVVADSANMPVSVNYSFSGKGNVWTTNDVTYNLSCVIPYSGLVGYQYSTDGTTWTDIPLNSDGSTATFVVTGTAGAKYSATYYFRAVSNTRAGLSSPGFVVNIDKTGA